MASKATSFSTGFGDQSFEIISSGRHRLDLAGFLFGDFPGTTSSEQPRRYEIVAFGKQPMLSLWNDEKILYYGQSYYQLAYTLMNEVIFHCINSHDKHHALHAGCVHNGNSCFLLPGKSGSGKSSLTGWLIANGYGYLTDELAFLSADGQIHPLPRPISLKVNSSHPAWPAAATQADGIISDTTGAMIPHRLLNPAYEACEPRVTHIIFPKFKAGAESELTELSPAKSSLRLLESHVNARNLDGHGIAELSNIVRQCQSFSLVYSSFEELRDIFLTPSGQLQ
ncbi:MAG: hypothetical protein ABFS19_11430 [Thermodesulfobacteriota bacterium]